MPQELHQKLFFLAEKEDLSMAELIRRFVTQGVKTIGKKKNSGETLLELADNAVKGIAKDISAKHDEYLYGRKSPY